MGKKTTAFSKTGINKLPNNKPALYKIKTESDNTNCAGIAKRGRVQEQIGEDLGKE
ncbi:MAG: hypothetical protein U9R17_06690 [Thermodesulfobacteriota bacterium]|nr:hypothetical protein [Thermodesulfobacteriota bacterium]